MIGTSLVGASVVDVTGKFPGAAGITVRKLNTGTPTKKDWNNYADCPCGSKTVVFSHTAPDGADQVAAYDGESFEVISGSLPGSWPITDPTNTLAYWGGQNQDGTEDLYGTRLDSESGLLRLSNRDMKLGPSVPMLITGTACFDASQNDLVIPFSEDSILHRVTASGRMLADVILTDPDAANPFHRLRLNPVFPNIVWYKRNADGPNPNGVATPPIYVCDLITGKWVDACLGIPGDHNAFSPDGMQIAFMADGRIYVSTIADAQGNLLAPTLRTVALPANHYPNYVVWTPDSKQFLCSDGPAEDSDVYLLTLDGKTVTPIISAKSTGKSFDGLTRAEFAGDSTILFTSDYLGVPQIYLVNGFKTA